MLKKISMVLCLVALLCLFTMPLGLAADIAPRCLAGRSKTTPGPMPNLTNCPQYRDLSCCSNEIDTVIVPSANHTQLYGFNWDRCGPLSPACAKFFQAESCYFECDPYQGPWADKTAQDPVIFAGIPVCSGYCEAWFEACKDDYTCGAEWLVDFVPITNSQGEVTSYGCREGTECKTFKEVYDNAQGLCDILWGSSFHYSEDLENCVTWDFGLTTGNLNRKIEKLEYTESFCNKTQIQIVNKTPKPSTPTQPSCLAGRELATPAPQPNLKNCPQYKDLSCCGTDRDSQINNDNTGSSQWYNWNGCGQLSPQCEQFFVDQACFFECDPYLAPWANPVIKNPSTFIGFPICENYCEKFFDACKNDKVCGHEWLLSFVKQPNSTQYVCAAGTNCLTVAEVYENGRGLCDVIWGAYYHYSEDEENCGTWGFTGTNPHKDMWKAPYAEGYCTIRRQVNAAAITLGVLFGVTFVGCTALVIFLIYREKTQKPLFGRANAVELK